MNLQFTLVLCSDLIFGSRKDGHAVTAAELLEVNTYYIVTYLPFVIMRSESW